MDAEAASSVLVSKTLEELGYNHEMVRFRQQLWGNVVSSTEDVYAILAGSKGEGLARYLESDFDILVALKDVLGTGNNQVLYNNTENLTVFCLDRANTSPGYTRLVCVKLGARFDLVALEALTEPIAGNLYLYNDIWRELIRLDTTQGPSAPFSDRSYGLDTDFETFRLEPVQGPSAPISNASCGLYVDQVVAIRCDCPDILQSWLCRQRRHGWPPAEVIEDISSLEAHVVPVGFKGSPFQNLEWRICFTRAEIKLVQSLNDTQTKLIILLKMIARSSLKPICKEMTTYVMKNIVLWLAEIFPPDCFTEQNLYLSLKVALRFLKKCLIARYLPSYMIPERNLLTQSMAHRNRSGHSARTRLCAKIDILQHEGPRMLLRCEKIRNAWNMLYTAPDTFYHFTNSCRQAEIIALLLIYKAVELDLHADEQQPSCLTAALFATIMPDWQKLLLLRQEDAIELSKNRMKLFLS